jgi:signal peptide peptidase SppA
VDPMPVPPPRRRVIWPWVLGGIALIGVILVFVIMITFTVAMSSGLEGSAERRVMLDDEKNEDGVFVEIPVEGVIVDAKTTTINPVTWLAKCLEKAGKEKNLKGVLLRVNSPGGGIRASAVMLKALREFKVKHSVPVVVWMKDVAASGGYYVSMDADWIVAHDDTITASIGVIWNTMNWEVLMKEKLGVRFSPVTSAPMKDIGSANRPMTEMERALIQSFVDDAFKEFVDIVVTGRAGKGVKPVTNESVRALESTILNGRRAYAEGLVDQLGYRPDAIAKLKELAGIARADVVEYKPPMTFMEVMLGGETQAGDPLTGELARLSFLYSEGPPLLAIWER